RVDLQSPERAFEGDSDVLGAAVGLTSTAVRVRDVPELGRQDDLVAPTGDRASDELLVRVRPVDLGRVDEVDAEAERALDRADRLGIVLARAGVEGGHAHAAEAEP